MFRLIFLKGMIDEAGWLSASKLRASFSYHPSSLRKRLNLLCATSTTATPGFLLKIAPEVGSLLAWYLNMGNAAMFSIAFGAGTPV